MDTGSIKIGKVVDYAAAVLINDLITFSAFANTP